jgi:CheY-like chemotaxis protein
MGSQPKEGKPSNEKQMHMPTVGSTAYSLKGHILVVEDDELSQELMKILLTKQGYRVTLALNGIEALRIFQTNVFDLILLDLQMPEMDGITTAKKIREMEANRSRIPIVALTASNISPDSSFQHREEIDIILTKPFEIQKIIQVIESKIERKTSQPTMQTEIAAEEGQAAFLDVRQGLPHFGFDQEQYREILEDFRQSLPGRIAEMEKAFRVADLTKLAYLAHNLKGVAANVGAMQLSEISAQLDEQCDDREMNQISKSLHRIENAMNALQVNAINSAEKYFASNPSHTRDE